MNDQELVKRVVAMLTKLRSLGGADKVYIFSPFFKPIQVDMDTMFGSLMNFSHWDDFSESQITGYKDIVNEFSDILTGFVRIADSVYKADEAHEYKTLPTSKGRELIKALVSRAVKVGRFDLSMMNPGWLSDEEEHKDVDVSQHKMAEAEGDASVDKQSDDPKEAIGIGLVELQSNFGDFLHDQIQIDEMEDMLLDAEAPYFIELTPSQDGIQIVGQNNVGVALYNVDGHLSWEF